MKTRGLEPDHITVELTEFEVTALAALIERGQETVPLEGCEQEGQGIRYAIHTVANEFRSLLGHFELTTPAANSD